MQQKDHERSLELLAQAKAIAEENNNNEDLFLTYNNIGANYYTMLDYGEALKNYQKAYDIAISSLEPTQEITTLNNIAILYSQEKNYKKAEDHFLKAYKLAKRNKEKEKTALYAINLSQVYNELNETEKAHNYIVESLKLTKNEPDLFLEAQIALLNNYYLKNQYDNARATALEILPSLKSKQYSEHRNFTHLTLSKIAQKEDLKIAFNYALIALEESSNLNEKINAYYQLSALYEEASQLKESIAIKDSIIKTNNELNKIKNGRLFESSKIKFEIQNYQKELLDQKQKALEQTKKYYLFIGIAVTIIVLLFIALRNSYISSQRKKKLHKRSEKIMELELDKKKTDNLLLKQQMQEQETLLLLEKEQLKNEIESKNRKLTAKAMYYSNQNELLSSIITDLETIQDSENNPQLNRQIKKMNRLIKNGDNWDDFINYFEEVNHGFISKLKNNHPDLNTSDIRFLSYLYMNLSTKEIASIFIITPETCRKRKERISKKMNLDKSSSLYDYLYTIH